MKKSHEYDSPVLSRLVSIVTVFAVCVCSICCIVTASKISTVAPASTGTAAPAGNAGGSASSGSSASTGNAGGSSSSSAGSSDSGAAAAPDAPAGEAPADDSAQKQEILTKYTEIMDQLKSGVATYEKKEFQTLADDYDLGTVGNLVLPIAQGLMTGEDEAELQKRDDAAQIPIIRNTKGCLLTDVSKIKSATMTESGGKTTIEIVLHDELEARPAADGATSCDSAVGSMFNPLDQKEIDNIVAEFAGVVSIEKFTLTCKDCKATLVFDTASGKVESLTQIMNYFIEVDATALIVPIAGYATLTNKMTINNVAYK